MNRYGAGVVVICGLIGARVAPRALFSRSKGDTWVKTFWYKAAIIVGLLMLLGLGMVSAGRGAASNRAPLGGEFPWQGGLAPASAHPAATNGEFPWQLSATPGEFPWQVGLVPSATRALAADPPKGEWPWQL